MNEQLSFLEPDEITNAIEILRKTLLNVLVKNQLSELSVSFEKLKSKKNSYSVKFNDSVIVRVFKGTKKTYIELPNVGDLKVTDAKEFRKIQLASLSEVSEHLDKISYSLQYILDHLPKDFSCCSRYEECSDRKSCIHPDKRVALGCYYRKVLVSGRIFYGKNRNIE